MNALLAKLFSGNKDTLDLIRTLVESTPAAPSGEQGQKLYAFLGSILCIVGLQLIKSHRKPPRGQQEPAQEEEPPHPPTEAWTSLHILATVGPRRGEDGVACRAALLALGFQNCKDMFLDAYFANPVERDTAVVFVCVLVNLFGCRLSSLLRLPMNISYMEVSAIPSLNVRVLFPNTANPLMGGNGCNGRVTDSSGDSPLVDAPLAFVPPRHQSLPPRLTSLSLLSPSSVPVIGVSMESPGGTNRRVRPLPKKAANTPYAVNPLFDPNTKAEENTVLPAQFPVPVSQFSYCFGLGCEPRIPTVQSFYQHSQSTVLRSTEEDPLKDETLPTGALLLASGSAANGKARRQENPKARRGAAVDTLKPLLTTAALATSGRVRTALERVRPPQMIAATSEGGAATPLGQQTPSATPAPPSPLVPTAFSDFTTPHPQPSAKPREEAWQSPPPPLQGGDTVGLSALEKMCHPTKGASLCFSDYNGDPAAMALNARSVRCELVREYLANGKLLGWGENTYCALGPLDSGAHRRPGTHPSSLSSPSLPSVAVPQAAKGRNDGESTDGFNTMCSAPSSLPMVLSGSASVNVAASIKTSPLFPSGFAPLQYGFAPSLVRSPGCVVDVACGTLSTHIVTSTGVLYSCGVAYAGQLGVGGWVLERGEKSSERFVKTQLSRDEQVVRVFAGCSTAAAITKDGYTYCWGANAYGQCLRQRDSLCVPLPIRFKAGRVKPAVFTFGSCFGGVLYEDGVVSLWGASQMVGRLLPPEVKEPALVTGERTCVRRTVALPASFDGPVGLLRMGTNHVLVISHSGAVYTWGDGHEGRLGHGTDADERAPRVVEGLRQHIAREASCGHMHTAVVVSTGHVFVFGENRFSQLGLRGLQARRTPVHLPLPAPAVAAYCGVMSSTFLLETGDVMACGPVNTTGVGLGHGRVLLTPSYILPNYVTLRLASGPTHSMACVLSRKTALMRVGHSSIEELSRVESLAVRSGVRDVAVGLGFVLVLSENGTMMALGRGERGQLGIGDSMRPSKKGEVTVVSSFQRVRMPTSKGKVEFISVVCGPDYVFALDQAARVFGWGSNEAQMLLLPPSVTAVYEPQLVRAYEGRGVLQMACGNAFAIALMDDGHVLTHGDYVSGYRSAEAETATPKVAKDRPLRAPSVVPGLRQAVAIAAGKYHAVAVTASGVVYAWGKGVLGNGCAVETVTLSPVKVVLPQSVRKLGCGPLNAFVITDVGDLFVWGRNEHGECGVPADSPQALPPDTTKGGSLAAATAPVATPTLVASGVRDAAFTAQFGFAVFEDGGVRASGTLRHGGAHYHLRSFQDSPQPPFAVDVNSAPPHRDEQHGTRGEGRPHRRNEGGGGQWTGTRQLASGGGVPSPERRPSSSSLSASSASSPSMSVTTQETPRQEGAAKEEARGRFQATQTSLSSPLSPMEWYRMPARTGRPHCSAGAPETRRQPQYRLSAFPPTTPGTVASPLTSAKGSPSTSSPGLQWGPQKVDTAAAKGNSEASRRASSPTPPPVAAAAALTSTSPTTPGKPSAFTGLRCFGGWDQVFAVVEKHRPPREEVRLARRGLQVYLRQKEVYEDSIT